MAKWIWRKSEEKDAGFSLIELLIVVIIMGILAAIAIPLFLSQRAKAEDTKTKADVSAIAKELASWWTDHYVAPDPGPERGTSDEGDPVWNWKDGTADAELIAPASPNVGETATGQHFDVGTSRTNWCIGLQNPEGTGDGWWHITGTSTLSQGQCPTTSTGGGDGGGDDGDDG